MMNATCGAKCYEQFKKLNPHSSLLKMSLVSRILMADWYSSRCALTWKMKGTKFNRLLFQLVPKTLRIAEIDAGLWLSTPRATEVPRSEKFAQGRTMSPSEYAMTIGLLPTPTAMMDEAPIEKVDARNQKQMEKGNSPFILGLGQQAMRGMLPTPTASDVEGGVSNPNQISHKNGRFVRTSNNTGTEFGAKLRDVVGMLPTPTAMDSTNATATMKSTQVKEGSMHSVTLNRAMAMGMLPTPQAQDHKPGPNQGQNSIGRMTRRGEFSDGKASQLNPRFVAEMMGFPPNWTELPFLSGETNPSKDTATP
jgi:hypothetical protein